MPEEGTITEGERTALMRWAEEMEARAARDGEARRECAAALKQARKAAREGDVARAERWARTAVRLADAAAKLAALPAPEPFDAEKAILSARFSVLELRRRRAALENFEAEAGVSYASWPEPGPGPARLSAPRNAPAIETEEIDPDGYIFKDNQRRAERLAREWAARKRAREEEG